jgi:hypothetical protein
MQGNVVTTTYYKDEKCTQVDFENTIVLYCEGVVGNPLKAKYVVRWILSKVGQSVPLDFMKTWDNNELVYFFNSEIDIVVNNSYDVKYLSLFYINPIFKNKNNVLERNGVCFTRRKNTNNFMELHNNETSFEITRDHTQNDYLDIFNKHEMFISYDPLTFLSIIAIKCGCISIIYPIDGVSKSDYFKMTALYEYMVEKNIESIYGIAYGTSEDEINYAKTTLHLFDEQLLDINNWFTEKYVTNFINDLNNWDDCNNNLINYKNNFININYKITTKSNMFKNISHFLDFDINFYRNYNEMQNLDDITLLNHYNKSGKNEGRVTSQKHLDEVIASTGQPDFDVEFYKSYYSDLSKFHVCRLIEHYNKWGKKEGRLICDKYLNQNQLNVLLTSTGKPYFDVDFYRSYYQDLNHMNIVQLINHYNSVGKNEYRVASQKELNELLVSIGNVHSNFDPEFYAIFNKDSTFNKEINRFVNDFENFQIVNDNYFKYDFTVGEDYNYSIINLDTSLIYHQEHYRTIDNFEDLLKYNNQYIKKYYFFNKESFYKYYSDFDYEYYKNKYFKNDNKITENEVLFYYHSKGKYEGHITNNKINIVIYTLPYYLKCGGIIVMHYIIKLINEKYNDNFHAKLFMHNNIRYDNPFSNEFARIDEINDNTIVIYPEIVSGNPLNAKNVVRWILLELGIEMPLDHPKKWSLNDLVYYWETKENSSNYKQLSCPFLNSTIFKNNNSGERTKTCYLVKKGPLIHKNINYMHPPNSICIDDCSLQDINNIFNECKFFYTYDANTAYIIYATICGCIPIIYPIDGISEEEYFKNRLYNFHDVIYNKAIVYGNDLNKINYILENNLIANNTEYYEELYNLYEKTTINGFLKDIDLLINKNSQLNNTVKEIYFSDI